MPSLSFHITVKIKKYLIFVIALFLIVPGLMETDYAILPLYVHLPFYIFQMFLRFELVLEVTFTHECWIIPVSQFLAVNYLGKLTVKDGILSCFLLLCQAICITEDIYFHLYVSFNIKFFCVSILKSLILNPNKSHTDCFELGSN